MKPFRLLRLLHLFIMIGLLVCVAFLSFLPMVAGLSPVMGEDGSRLMQGLVVIVTLLVFVWGLPRFRKRLLEARKMAIAGEKWLAYRQACLVWWGLNEAAGILAGIGYFLTGNFAFLALALLHWLVIIFFMPRRANVMLLLNLRETDLDQE